MLDGCDLWEIVANEENGEQLVDRPSEVRKGTSRLHLRFCNVVRYEVEEGRGDLHKADRRMSSIFCLADQAIQWDVPGSSICG